MQPPGLLPALLLVGCYGGWVWRKPERVCGRLPHRGTISEVSTRKVEIDLEPAPRKLTYVSQCCWRVDGWGHNKASGRPRSAQVRAAESSPESSRWPVTQGNGQRHQRSSSADGTVDRVRATRGSDLHVARVTKARHLDPLWGADARGCPKPGGGGSPHLCRPAHEQRSRLPAGQQPRAIHRRSACTIAPPHTSLPDAVGVSAPATLSVSPLLAGRQGAGRVRLQRQPVMVEPHFT
jgi:hypothetical protein